MASAFSVLVAVCMHLVIHYVLFEGWSKGTDTPGSSVASVIVCLSILDLIYDNRLVPLCLYGSNICSKFVRFICESAMATLLLEVGTLVIWNSLEFTLYVVVHTLLLGLDLISNDTYRDNEAMIIGAFTSSLAVFILAMTNHATQHLNHVFKSIFGGDPRVTFLDNLEIVDPPSDQDEDEENRRFDEDLGTRFNLVVCSSCARRRS